MSFSTVSEESGDRLLGLSGEVWNHHQSSGGIGQTARGKRWRFCLLLMIESCNVFRETKAAGTHPVNWTSVLEEACTKFLSFRDSASLWWKGDYKSFLCLAISHDPFLKSYTNPPKGRFRASGVRSSLLLALLDQWFSNLSAGWNHHLGSFRNFWRLGPPRRLWFNWSGCDCSFWNF